MSLRTIKATFAVVAGAVLWTASTSFAALPGPSSPVGQISMEFPIVSPGMRPLIRWSAGLPSDAIPGDLQFFVRQEQLQEYLVFDLPVAQEGEALSPLVSGEAGSKFELWAVRQSPLAAYLLDTAVVSPYLPGASVTIRSEDPYPMLPRTRADRPFQVDVVVQGIVNTPEAPNSLKGVTLVRHGQAYGPGGTGAQLDREEATLLSETPIVSDGSQTLSFPVSGIPGAGYQEARGEERFSIISQPGFELPAPMVISSRTIQVWPVAGASISGLAPGQTVGPGLPEITIELNDLYPSSTTFAQVYPGALQSGVSGTVVPGSRITLDDSVPADRTLVLNNYGSVFDSNGIWTLEVLTQTPFGTDRITHVTFSVQDLVTTVDDWLALHFGAADGGGDDGDFEKDGLPNLVEYAFGFDPKSSSAGLLPVATRVGSDLEFRFDQPAGVGGIRYGAEFSETLLPGSWVSIEDSGELPEHVFKVPMAGKPRLYLRLTVTRK